MKCQKEGRMWITFSLFILIIRINDLSLYQQKKEIIMGLSILTSYEYHTEKGRLAIYKKALADYNKRYSEMGEIDKYYHGTGNSMFGFGLCYYFAKRYDNINAYDLFPQILPELYQTKPDANSWWFSDGELLPRIECLKKAIKITKEKIK